MKREGRRDRPHCQESATSPSTCSLERLHAAELPFQSESRILEGFVAGLQVISAVLVLLQGARLRGAERNGGGRSDENQILKVSCQRADNLSCSVRLVDRHWLITWCSVGAASRRGKGFTVLAHTVARQTSIGAETTKPSSHGDLGGFDRGFGSWSLVCGALQGLPLSW